MRRRSLPALPALLALLGFAASTSCGGPAAESPPPEAPPSEGVYGLVAPAVGFVPSVITLEPDSPVEVARPQATMDQLGLQFSPRNLIAGVGEPVRFTNSESLAHNVHIRSVVADSTVLNADTPPSEALTFVFEEEGGYEVLCDVHPGMTAFIFVTSAPYGMFAEPDGSFHLTGVPPGAYTVRVWSIDAEARGERTITVTEGTASEVSAPPFG